MSIKDKYKGLPEPVAFVIAFVPMAYTYDDIAPIEYYQILCTKCRRDVQNRDFLAPRASFKKDYGILDMLEYFVSEELKNELICRFDIGEQDFRPIRNKNGDAVAFQITPQHTMLPISPYNRIRSLKPCKKCGSVQYRINEYKTKEGDVYYFISQQVLDDMRDINCTEEQFEMFSRLCFVSKRVYEYLISKYPHMRLYPVFLKEK